MTEKTFRKVCECKNCGNEAEMMITCTLQAETPKTSQVQGKDGKKAKTKEHAVCSHCGGEADIWLDL
jgi:hypothetical protein